MISSVSKLYISNLQTVMYGKMVQRLKKRPLSISSKQNRRRKRVHNSLLAMILIFWITRLPQFIFTVYAEISALQTNSHLIFAILRLFGAMNTISNPLLYGYMNSTIRKYYKKIYRRLPWHSTSALSYQITYKSYKATLDPDQPMF